jgi:hypothetical protein
VKNSLKPIRVVLGICILLSLASIGASAANIYFSGILFISITDVAALIAAVTAFFGFILFGMVTEYFSRAITALGRKEQVVESFAPPTLVTTGSDESFEPIPVRSAPSIVRTP